MVQVGIIGCGALGVIHAKRFSAIPDVQVIALADPAEAAMDRAAAALPHPPRVRSMDYRDVLDAGLDAACIATPDAFHVPQLLDALAANLHVLCEKPLTLDPSELEAVLASRDEVKRVVAMTYPRRWDRGMQAMREEILSGRWGRVTAVTIYNAEDWITPNVGTWRHDPAVCPGGFLYDANGHQLDTVFWATGLRAETVRAQTDNRGTPSPMVTWGTAELTGAVPMVFSFVGDAHKWREQVNIHCEGTDFAIENSRAMWVQGRDLVPLPSAAPPETTEEAFIRLIHGEGLNWAPPDDVWPVLEFTRAALQSAARHETVRASEVLTSHLSPLT